MQIVADSLVNLNGATVSAAADLPFGHHSEPGFDLVERRTRGRREVRLEARPGSQPTLD
jgi:hypothetical protein